MMVQERRPDDRNPDTSAICAPIHISPLRHDPEEKIFKNRKTIHAGMDAAPILSLVREYYRILECGRGKIFKNRKTIHAKGVVFLPCAYGRRLHPRSRMAPAQVPGKAFYGKIRKGGLSRAASFFPALPKRTFRVQRIRFRKLQVKLGPAREHKGD
jgi:hypothetical protein